MALTKYNYNSFDITPVASKALAFNSDADGFTTPAEGSMVLIKTITASSDSTISFVDGTSDVVLDNTYPVYVFKFINIHPATDGTQFTFNGSDDDSSHAYDITKTTSWFNIWNKEDGTGTSLTYQAEVDLAQSTAFQDISSDLGADNDQSLSGTMWLFDPSSTTFIKHFLIRNQTSNNSDRSRELYCGGYFNTTADITAIQFKMASGNIDAGTIKLYGLKDS